MIGLSELKLKIHRRKSKIHNRNRSQVKSRAVPKNCLSVPFSIRPSMQISICQSCQVLLFSIRQSAFLVVKECHPTFVNLVVQDKS